MMAGLLAMIALYGTGAMFIHMAHRHAHKQRHYSFRRHYIVDADQNELQIEWTIRSLLWLAWFKGEELYITVIDHGSTDDTMAIIDRLLYDCHHDTIQVIHA